MRRITASELVNSEFDTLVSGDNRLEITGDVFHSFALRGSVGIETDFGILYVHADDLVTVED